MQVLETIAAFKEARRQAKEPLGFVPTMGYLHEGHLSLVRRARAENGAVAASIFVNPTQFGPTEGLASYPRDMERDLALLDKEGVELVFCPTPQEIYPSGFNTWVDVFGVSERLEGAHRPGHFRGVATVVAKLFNIVEPARAYFGQKDAQQVMVIKKMAADLNLNLGIVVCPTVREPDGLAMSSRNVHLSPEERRAALVLSRSLFRAEALWRSGEGDAEHLRREITSLIAKEPLAKIDYVSVANPETLAELERIEGGAIDSLAVKIGKTRLIDNVVLA